MGNYGGMLQGYALHRAIAAQVQTPCYLESCRKFDAFVFRYKIKNIIGALMLSCGKKMAALAVKKWFKYKIVRPFYRLINTDVPMTVHEEVDQTAPVKLQYVVGSDQVWRKCYADGYISLPFFFLDFATVATRNRSIAYAASFGSDEWEGTPEETKRCGELLREFRAISVREHSGIEICKNKFGVKAVQMPDPTLLLQAADYDKLISSASVRRNAKPYIASYVLDSSPEKQASIQGVARQLGLPLHPLCPVADSIHRRERAPMSVPQWLSYLRHAQFVLTDSFHGCVFAILFNKPFVCYGNEQRGMARFNSLMQTFRLQSRLVRVEDNVAEVLSTPIDWVAINRIHEQERQRGLAFLKEHLT